MFPLKDNVPTRSFPIVTVALIAINFAVWIFYQLPDLNRSVAEYAYQPCEVVSSCPPGTAVGHGWFVTAFTSMFMHGSWLHIIGNMLFLWIFGNNVEDAMGRFRYLAFYLLAGLAGTLTQSIVTLWFASPAEAQLANVGASGAIAGVLGAYFILLPSARVLTLIFFVVIEVPAVLVLGLWFVFQLWSGSASFEHPEEGGGVAFFAHIGGFVFGMLTVNLFAMRRPAVPGFR